MEAYLNRIDGWDDAIISMYLSKRTLTRELEEHIREITSACTNTKGISGIGEKNEEFNDWLKKLFKWCPIHITMGRFLDFSFSVYGMHRAGQD